MNEQRIPSPELFTCKVPVDVRWRDNDGLGHVNNAVFLTYFEIGRTVYFKEVRAKADSFRRSPQGDRGRSSRSDPPESRHDFPFIIARATVDFRSPAKFGDTLIVHLRVNRIGTRSFEFEYLITAQADGRAVATGTTVQACYDYSEGKTTNMPADFRDAILRYESTRPEGA